MKTPINRSVWLFLTIGMLLALENICATTVIPPTFPELVGRAEVIFQGTVSDVRSQWTGEGAERHIVSYVAFKVDDVIKGNPGREYVLQMLGGTVGDQTMEVTDAPRFKVGDRDVLFVEHNGTQFVPLVGIMHGRFRIQKDAAGRDMVLTNDGEPVTDVAQLGHAEAAVSGGGLSIQDFKQSIRNVAGTHPAP